MSRISINSRKRISLILLITASGVIISGCGFLGIKKKQAKQLTMQASILYEEGNITESSKLLTKALAKDVHNKEATQLLAKIYNEENQYRKAIELIEQIDKDSITNELLLTQGLSYYYLLELDKAESVFQEILTKDSGNFKAILNLGVLYADKGDYQRSLKFFDKATVLEPDNIGVLYNKATVLSDYAYQKKLEAGTGFAVFAYNAIQLLDAVLIQDNEYINAYIYKGIIYYDVEDYTSALNAITNALILDGTSLDALYYQGKIYNELGQEAMAIDSFKAMLSIDPGNIQASQELIQISALQEDI